MVKLFISFLFIFFISCSNTLPTTDLGPEDFNSSTDAKEYYSQKIKEINSVTKNELSNTKNSVLKEIKSAEKEFKSRDKDILKERKQLLTVFHENLSKREKVGKSQKNNFKKELKKRKKELSKKLKSIIKSSRNKSDKLVEPIMKEFTKKVKKRESTIKSIKKDYEKDFKRKEKDKKKKLKEMEKSSEYDMEREISRVRENYKLRYLTEEATLISRQEALEKSIDDKEQRIREHSVMSLLETQIQAEKVQIAQVEQITNHLNHEIFILKENKQLTTKDIKNTFNHISDASILFQNGKYYQAMVSCKLALEIDPELFVATAQLGSIYYVLGYNEKAFELYSKALELNPNANDIADMVRQLQKNTNEIIQN